MSHSETHPTREPPNMLADYPFVEARFDELFAAPMRPRPHWDGLFAELAGTSRTDLRDRQAAAERQIRESGVTYNVYADPQGPDHPWDLDVLPLIIAPDEWRSIEAGIAQRATLLNRVLADLYGSQSLLRSGLIPASLIHSHSGFLRPAHGITPPGGVHLHVYAADLARSPDGQWWVMSDRTQAPSGAGYALENRLIVSRTFPALFRDLQVRHLAQFFATLRDSLLHFSPKGDGPPLCVLLTPGPYNETYFEHTLLARYLGFPLVEGGDLTVRDGRVWLKTLGGLRRVHGILRRQDDTYCDPLELRTDSALGVAGLTDCARRGTVLIANSLGSGLLESGAILGFLPKICEQLLDEPLQLPSVATWWCGEPAALQDALGHAESLVFKSTDPADAWDTVFGPDLDAAGLAELRAHLLARPERFVAQELVRVSQAPVLSRRSRREVTARGIGLRVFAVASPVGYVVMPGGLTRVASGPDLRIMTMQRGGGSKDTWVVSDGPEDESFTLLRETVAAADIRRSGLTTPSRIAENLFWLGRYQERCDDEARLLREALDQSLREKDDEGDAIRPVLSLARAYDLLDDPSRAEACLLAAATQESVPFGLPANLRTLERLAHTLRDRFSLDNLRTLSGLLKDPVIGDPAASLVDTLSWLDRTVTNLTTLSGFTLDGMTRDDGWRFLSIGRRLERLTFQCLAIETAFGSGIDTGLTWLLRLSDSIVTYHSRYMSRPEWMPVLDLLVMDAANPRSILFHARGLVGYLARIEDTYGPCQCGGFGEATRRIEHFATTDLHPENRLLREAIIDLRRQAYLLSDLLSQRFFNHVHTGAWSALGL